MPIFICDGNPTYEGVVKGLKKTAFLIQHIHSHPWKDAKLHYFEVDQNGSNIVQTTILLPYNSFTTDGLIEVAAATKHVEFKELSPIKNSKGRPKGKKDSKKRAKYGSIKNKNKVKGLKKRGRKNLSEKGAKSIINSNPYENGWDPKITKNVSKKQNLVNPDLNVITTILNITFEIMNGGAIQSNLIESKNSLIKRILNKNSLKKVYQYEYITGAIFLGRKDVEKCYWEVNANHAIFNNSLGFSRMLTFFTPKSENVEVI